MLYAWFCCSSVGNPDLIFVQIVLLKDILELSNYIDRSQLTAPLGGYLIYCHQSWVAFIKVILDLENVSSFALKYLDRNIRIQENQALSSQE